MRTTRSTERADAKHAWVRLAQAGDGPMNLHRPLSFVLVAAFGLLGWWWLQHADLDSPRLASKAAFYAWAGPLAVIAFLTMAIARVLVTRRVVAALYGRSCPGGGVELSGFAGRFGWVFARRRFTPGRIHVKVEALAPVRRLPEYVISVRQGAVCVVVSADIPWDPATTPTLAVWLADHGCDAEIAR